MQATQEYKYLPVRPSRLDATWVEAHYAGLIARCPGASAAKQPAEWLELFAEWNAVMGYIGGEQARRYYATMKDLTDKAAEDLQREMREEILPTAEVGDAAMTAAFIESPHADAVGARYGEQILAVLRVLQGPVAPVNKDLRVKANTLASEYDKLVGAGEVTVGGETMTLSRARGKISSGDATERREAFEEYFGWFRDNRDTLAAIYDKQVTARNQMGRNLGHKNFVPLGYDGMERTDYGPEKVAEFHAAVIKYAVPLVKAQHEKLAAAHGTPTLKPWDAAYFPGRSLPQNVSEPIDEQLDKASRLFERLSPRLAAHFERMREEGLIDLENRKGKGAGAFCTSFADEGRVAILCNSTGDESDIGTLTHEMGHAFQGWESQHIEAVYLQWPTSDAAEVHSMGMEYLSLPYLTEFFTDEQVAKFTRTRWSRGIHLLCYCCSVDAFQTWVYEHPSASPDARDVEWMRLQDLYLPGIDWSDDAAEYQPTRWYAQMHIFRLPFYYIDYAIAETGAMQFGMLDTEDHERCLKTYIALCELGGTKSVTKLFASAGLRSPFDAAVMSDLMEYAKSKL